MNDDDRNTRRFLTSPPPSATGERYKLVAYVSPDAESWWDRAVEPPSSDDDEEWFDHRLLVACEAPSVAELLSAFGRFIATDGGTDLEKANAAVMSGEDTGDAWQCTDPEMLAFLRTFDDPGRRFAAFLLLGVAPFTYETTLADCEAYFRYLPATFPNHELVVAWQAAPPHQEEGFAILRESSESKTPARKKRLAVKPKRKRDAVKPKRKRAAVSAKGGAKRSTSPRRASRRKPARRR